MPQYTISEYAKKVGKSRWTIYNWLKANTLPRGAEVLICCGKKMINVKED